eukprot:Nk52_evm54s554 gene=Nk52_evmTU54s554
MPDSKSSVKALDDALSINSNAMKSNASSRASSRAGPEKSGLHPSKSKGSSVAGSSRASSGNGSGVEGVRRLDRDARNNLLKKAASIALPQSGSDSLNSSFSANSSVQSGTADLGVVIANVQMEAEGNYFFKFYLVPDDSEMEPGRANKSIKSDVFKTETAFDTMEPAFSTNTFLFETHAALNSALEIECWVADASGAGTMCVGKASHSLYYAKSRLLKENYIEVSLFLVHNIEEDNIDVNVGKISVILKCDIHQKTPSLESTPEPSTPSLKVEQPIRTPTPPYPVTPTSPVSEGFSAGTSGFNIAPSTIVHPGMGLALSRYGSSSNSPDPSMRNGVSLNVDTKDAKREFLTEIPDNTRRVYIHVHNAWNLPKVEGEIPSPYVSAKSERDGVDKKKALARTHASPCTQKPIWDEMLVVDMSDADIADGHCLILSVADKGSRRYLGKYLLPIREFFPFHQYNMEMVSTNEDGMLGLHLYATVLVKTNPQSLSNSGRMEVKLKRMTMPLSSKFAEKEIIAAAKIVYHASEYRAQIASMAKMGMGGYPSVPCTTAYFPNPDPSAFDVMSYARTNSGSVDSSAPQITKAAEASVSPAWNHVFLFTDKEQALFNSNGALVIEYFQNPTRELFEQLKNLGPPPINGYKWEAKDFLGYSIIPLNEARRMQLENLHCKWVESEKVKTWMIGDQGENFDYIADISLRYWRPDDNLTDAPLSRASSLNPVLLPLPDSSEGTSDVGYTESEPWTDHRSISTAEIPQKKTNFRIQTPPKSQSPPQPQPPTPLPDLQALAALLPNLKSATPSSVTSVGGDHTSEEFNRKLMTLTQDIEQKQTLINRLMREVDERTDAIKRLGKDIITLREQNVSLVNQNAELKTTIKEKDAATHTIIESTDLDSLDYDELVERYVILSQKYQLEARHSQEYQVRLENVQNTLIKKNDLEKRHMVLQSAHTAQCALVQKLQESSSKSAKYEATCKQQEKVIKKLEDVVEKYVKNSSMGGDHFDSETFTMLAEENAGLREQIAELQKGGASAGEWGPLVIGAPEVQKLRHELDSEKMRYLRLQGEFLSLKNQFQKEGRAGGIAGEPPAEEWAEEKIQLMMKLETAEARIRSLESQLEENARKFAQELTEYKLKLAEKEMNLGSVFDSRTSIDGDFRSLAGPENGKSLPHRHPSTGSVRRDSPNRLSPLEKPPSQ